MRHPGRASPRTAGRRWRRAHRYRGRCRRSRCRAPLPPGSSRITTARFSASSDAVGSSSSRIGWPAMKPRARLTRCCSPPENVAGGMRVQPRRDIAAAAATPGLVARGVRVDAARQQHLGDDVQRGHPRHDAQELADIAQGFAAALPGWCAGRRTAISTIPPRWRTRIVPLRRGNCRTGCASAWICRRPTARTARRTRRRGPRDRRRTAPASAGRPADAA